MGILQPTPGELLDRQTILTLKAHYALRAKKEPHFYTKEIEDIQRHLEIHFFAKAPKSIQMQFDTLLNSLRLVNTQLWRHEDEIRMSRLLDTTDSYVKTLAYRIADLNDQRAKLIVEVNALFGVDAHEEKLYTKCA
jgi:hypothetical protein